jgi:hypothetical protein
MPTQSPSARLGVLRRKFYQFRKRNGPQIVWRQLTGHDGVLPGFLIIGAQRGGTTSLFHYLQGNPALSRALVKEVHYFDNYYRRGPGWYKANFPAQTGDSRPLTYEATPYLFAPHAARRAHETVPDAKLIVLLRNPIERAYSHYKLLISARRETRSFEDALRDEPADLDDDLKRIAVDEFFHSPRVNRYGYLAKGLYLDQLMTWQTYFPRERFLILRSEDLFADPNDVLRQIADFLGIPRYEGSDFTPQNVSSGSSLDPATRRRLADYFREPNARLYQYLSRDMGWE